VVLDGPAAGSSSWVRSSISEPQMSTMFSSTGAGLTLAFLSGRGSLDSSGISRRLTVPNVNGWEGPGAGAGASCWRGWAWGFLPWPAQFPRRFLLPRPDPSCCCCWKGGSLGPRFTALIFWVFWGRGGCLPPDRCSQFNIICFRILLTDKSRILFSWQIRCARKSIDGGSLARRIMACMWSSILMSCSPNCPKWAVNLLIWRDGSAFLGILRSIACLNSEYTAVIPTFPYRFFRAIQRSPADFSSLCL